MSVRRDDFPAVSIGRTAGNRLQSSLGLETHPLLSPRPASPAPSEHGSITGGASLNNNSVQPRYVPYTPRQRVTPTATTTGTTVHPPSPQYQSGDATSKLQLMHLKAAAQVIGLDSGTLGWAMVEKLVLDAEVAEEWTEVWTAITSGKATLLLPLEAAFTQEKITPDFMKDHIVLCDGPSRNNAPIVTLSGLRGTLEDETLTFRSTINVSSKLFHDLLAPSTRTQSLSRVPPLPAPLPNIPPVSYPHYQLTTHTSSLHLPPRSQTASKPPLPPRPGTRAHPPLVSTSRIGNPFASLFGGSAKPAPHPQPPPSPPTSLRSFDSQSDASAPVEVSAFAIDRRIVREDVAKKINKALRSELKAAIKSSTSSLPHWVTERIHDLTANWYPFINNVSKDASVDTATKDTSYLVNSIEENIEDTSEHLQDFFASLEQDLRLAGGPSTSRKVEKESESEVEDVKDREKREQGKMETEAKIRETMEAVERLITWLFYDRLFGQPTTDDASHDEALSNRIAALNLLDLGLGHLGIDIGEVNEPDLNAVVKACGEMLSQLDSCRCPADKAVILVAAHKIVVDGLARLPPVRLISEDEAKSQVGDGDVPLTARPRSSPISTASVSDASADPEHSTATNNPASQALIASDTPENTTQPETDTNASFHVGKEPHPDAKSRTKPVPPPLNLDAPKLQVPRPLKEPTPVSGDVLFPLIIFSVVKANPIHLVSNLLFTQRFRNQSIGGEESYCLINMMAVAEFLENVDMAALGLDNTDKIISTADLTPILPNRSPVTVETPLAPSDGAVAALRGRVEQRVDAITDSANKVISGVVDSSFGILRSFMPAGAAIQTTARSASSGRSTPGTPGRTSFGLMRRESGFSIANLAASLPIAGRKLGSSGSAEEAGQQLMSVSRPASRSPKIIVKGYQGEDDEDDDEADGEDEESVSSKDESEEDAVEDNIEPEVVSGDAKRLRSFESMLSASRESRKVGAGQQPRKTLSDRLASMSGLANLKGTSPSSSRRSSVNVPSHQRSKSTTSAVSSRADSPDGQSGVSASSVPRLRLAPPKQRFMECTPDDLRLSEVGELVREYRRLVDGVRAVGGFDE